MLLVVKNCYGHIISKKKQWEIQFRSLARRSMKAVHRMNTDRAWCKAGVKSIGGAVSQRTPWTFTRKFPFGASLRVTNMWWGAAPSSTSSVECRAAIKAMPDVFTTEKTPIQKWVCSMKCGNHRSIKERLLFGTPNRKDCPAILRKHNFKLEHYLKKYQHHGLVMPMPIATP